MRNRDPYALEPLQPVLEHGPVRLAQDIEPKVHHEIRTDAQDVASKAAWWSLQSATPLETMGSRAGRRLAGCGPPRAVPGAEPADRASLLIRAQHPLPERLLMKPTLGDHGHVCAPGFRDAAVLAGRRQGVLLVVHRDEEAQRRGLVADHIHGPDRHVLARDHPEQIDQREPTLHGAAEALLSGWRGSVPRCSGCASRLISPRASSRVRRSLTEYVSLPRGCRDDLEALLGSAGSTWPSRSAPARRAARSPVPRRADAVQEQAAQALLSHDAGVFVAASGIGKTVVGTYLVAARGRSTLVLVHRQPLLDQWVAQLGMFLGLDPKAIGQIGAGKRKPTGRLDVAMLQSLVREGRVTTSWRATATDRRRVPSRPGGLVRARPLRGEGLLPAGLTATPRRRDGLHPILEMQLGPVRFAVDAKSQAARRPLSTG